MLFKKNIQFTRLIMVNGRAREFNFRKKQVAGNDIYDVNVTDEKGNRHYISVVQENGAWSVRESAVPGWLPEAFPKLLN